jgi:Tol biopolymer transport system component
VWAGLGLIFCLSVVPGMADAPVAGTDRLAFVEELVAGQDGYVVDVGRSTTTRLTRGLAEVEGPVWSPDGTRLAFAAKSGGRDDRPGRAELPTRQPAERELLGPELPPPRP